jgi:hypothetical protein
MDTQMSNCEEWRPIKGTILEVSSIGRVRSPRGILKPQLEGGGYLYVRVYNPRRNIKVHIALCEAFHGERPSELHMALHRDDLRINNTVENVYWGTREDNTSDMLKNGNKYLRGNDFNGAKNPNAKLTPEDVVEIKRLHREEGLSGNDISLRYPVSNSAIHKILQGASWT